MTSYMTENKPQKPTWWRKLICKIRGHHFSVAHANHMGAWWTCKRCNVTDGLPGRRGGCIEVVYEGEE